MSVFTIQPNTAAISDAERSQILAQPGFGAYFTDHMALAQWSTDQVWHGHRIAATAPLQLHPSAAVLHYGQEIFEGMKAYRHDEGSVWLFRPEKNAARFAKSAVRLGMPALPEDVFLDSVFSLVDLDRAWVPENSGEQNLYLRPFMIASEPLIGVRAATQYTYCVLATPAGAYYSAPMRLWITPNYSRASVGGTGEAKCGGNYAASLAAADEAAEQGCGQVLWLDGAEHRWIEECGTMNICFITADGELITPALRGTILDGVTRDSVLQLAGDHALQAVERPIDVDELRTRVTDGSITEVLACGTAAVVTPITGFKAPDGSELTVADGEVGPKTSAIRRHLLDIQYGRAADTRGWMHRVGA
ncbi:branched-chain amino acid aminotransferase [Aestuariimicrobium ganziense]|uniref:branched-chain amino acid aminotransferase n=1 Tax=Aestuariimicrobium ganziense TaxID=2773677 RepID=UPI001941C823|nr:branched-chain amino acid aminotransferase [Aestuariimicrobium ganziense]